ncbi:hypothetical protein ACFL3G_01280 [Planctomycetota bacterium]
MNNLRYILFCCICLTVALVPVSADQQPADSGSDQVNTLPNIGRSNPFEPITLKKPVQKTVPEKADTTATVSELLARTVTVPDLVVEELYVKTVTLKFLNAQNLKEAVSKMSSSRGLIAVDTKSNSLIICDTKQVIEKIVTEIQKADRTDSTPTDPELFIKTVTLRFLNADNLKKAIGKVLSTHGQIAVDSKSNSLIICDTKENVEKIIAEIKKADKVPYQIMVEVVILDVQLEDDTEIGINWDILTDKNHTFGYRQNFTSRIGSTLEQASSIGDATAFNSTGLGGDFSIITGTIRRVVHMIQQKRDVEILASPRVMMVSGGSARIEAVEEKPYTELGSTSAGTDIESTQFKNVGVTLDVNALLVDDENIMLTIRAEQNVQTGESLTGVPVVDTRIASSSLLLKDGQVVVFGGLRRQDKILEVDQIPIISEIPIIGELFKSTSVLKVNTELMVFISPHIYRNGQEMKPEELMKFNEITKRPMLMYPDKKISSKEMMKKFFSQKDDDYVKLKHNDYLELIEP